MRKFFGTSGCISSLSFLLAILFLLFSVSFGAPAAHAQACLNINLNDPPAFTISPVFWAPGQNYNVTVTDPNAEFFPSTPPPNTSLFIFDQSQYTPGGPVYLEDPNVTRSFPTYVSPTQATFTVSVAAGAPIESDGINFTCLQTGFVGAPGFMQITPCAIPIAPGPLTPASIQADTWVAGQQTNITITGSGFIPDGNPNGCQSTSLSITAGAENVNILSVSVVSSTQIAATVEPQITDPAETATLTVSNYQYNDPANPLTSSTTAQIVPNLQATVTDTSQLKDGIISVNLVGPTGTTGDLTLTFVGSTQEYTQTFSSLQPGSHSLDLSLPDVTADTYSSIDGTWATNIRSVDVSPYSMSSPWVYFGYVRYTQYNVPTESLCSNTQGTAWLVTTSCSFTQISLRTTFISQAWLNGTGTSIAHGILKNAAAVNLGDQKGPCVGKYPNGAIGHGATGGNTFEVVSSITGSCNKTLVNNQSAAVPASGNPLTPIPLSGVATLSCGNQLNLDSGNNSSAYSRTAADLCSACSDHNTFLNGTVGHVDSYSSSQTCQSGPGKLADLGDFYSIKTK